MFAEHLNQRIRARFPILYLVSTEEVWVQEILEPVAAQLLPPRVMLWWDVSRGWSDDGSAKGSVMAALGRVAQPGKTPTLFVLKDLHPFLRSPVTERNTPIIRELKNLSQDLKRSRNTLLLLSPVLEVPSELSDTIAILDLPLPTAETIAEIIHKAVPPEQFRLEGFAKEQLLRACQGLSRERIQRTMTLAIAQKQQVDSSDISAVLLEKQQAIRQTEILEFFTPEETLQQVGGLDLLKQWVRTRRDAFTEEAQQYGIPAPKGILLAGIQGTGKSLSAKTIANEWQLPLLRLDTGRLFGGIVGESESRVRQMIRLTEAIAPCVLWIDEIDKAFGQLSSADSDAGTSRRVFATLLTWMQEKTSAVFVVATANNVQVLPAELLRKGRFDELFFLNLPTEAERQDIFKVHLKRLRPTRLRSFNMKLLAKQTKAFSGAEIAQTIVDGMHRAFGEGSPGQRRDFCTEDILIAIEETVPLSAIAAEQIQSLKQWAVKTGARTASRDTQLHAELQQYSANRPNTHPEK